MILKPRYYVFLYFDRRMHKFHHVVNEIIERHAYALHMLMSLKAWYSNSYFDGHLQTKRQWNPGQKPLDCCMMLCQAGAETWHCVAPGEQPKAGGTKGRVLAATNFLTFIYIYIYIRLKESASRLGNTISRRIACSTLSYLYEECNTNYMSIDDLRQRNLHQRQ